MKIWEILLEAVGGNVLYHSVSSGKTAEKIMQSGIINPSVADTDADAGEDRPVISTSRDQFYRFPYGGGVVQFVLDKQALRSAGFKIVPFSYRKFYKDDPSAADQPVTGNILHKQESEERIYHPKGIGIPVKKPFVLAVQIHPDIPLKKIPKSFKKRADDEGIELQQMKKFKQPKKKSPYSDPNKVKVHDDGYTAGNDSKKRYPWGEPRYYVVYDKGNNTYMSLSDEFTDKKEAESKAQEIRAKIQNGEDLE